MQQVIRKNHMDIAWHEYTDENGENVPVTQASLTEKASIIGRVGIMFLSCGSCGSGGLSTGGSSFYWSSDSWPAGIYDKKQSRLSANLPDGSFYCHHGARPVSL